MTLNIAYLIPMHENNTESKGDLILEFCSDQKRNGMKLQPLNFSLQVKKLRYSGIVHLFENRTELKNHPPSIKLPSPSTVGEKKIICMR